MGWKICQTGVSLGWAFKSQVSSAGVVLHVHRGSLPRGSYILPPGVAIRHYQGKGHYLGT